MRKPKPKFVEREEVTALRRNFPSVHRVRVSDKTIAVKRDPQTGEELWSVGGMIMTDSEMVEFARDYM